VFREPEVMSSLVEHLRHLDYPAERLQILLLAEADDSATIAAARVAIGAAADLRILIVPPGGPRTKPKALNYGLTHATGTFSPSSTQKTARTPYNCAERLSPLTAAARGGLSAGRRLLQRRQNVITRWFQVEYSMWFRKCCRLVEIACPHTLGGTSTTFARKSARLGRLGPYNVTEDADLGVRLSRAGYRSEVMDSLTLEEANSDFRQLAKQRSRWYKGYLQTFLVHMRDFRSRSASWVRAVSCSSCFSSGYPAHGHGQPDFLDLDRGLVRRQARWLMAVFPAPLYFLGLFCWLAGNFLFTFTACWRPSRSMIRSSLPPCLTPVYWVMMSVAAYKALVQVFFAPAYWEKTRHGLAKAVVGATAPARPTP